MGRRGTCFSPSLRPTIRGPSRMHVSVNSPPRSLSLRLVIIAGLVAASGCTGRGTGNVSGRVTYQGKPVASGSVTMAPDEGPPISGVINEDGTYVCRNVP